jgi:hypothetical protein
LLDELEVLFDHRLLDLLKRAVRAQRIAGLDQGGTHNPGHIFSEEGNYSRKFSESVPLQITGSRPGLMAVVSRIAPKDAVTTSLIYDVCLVGTHIQFIEARPE